MDKDQRELIRHLFSKAIELAEIAHDSAVQGQSAALKAAGYADVAEELRQAALGISRITDAIVTIINFNCDERSIN